MAAHQAGRDLQVLLLGFLARPDDPLDPGRIGSETLLHEHVHALLHGIFQMDRPKARMGCQQGHIAGLQAVDRFAVGVEAQELPLRGNVDRRAELAGQAPQRGVQTRLENVGRGDQLGIAVGHRQRIGHRSRPAASAADQRQTDRVVLGRVNLRNGHRGQRGACRQDPAVMDELALRHRTLARVGHVFPCHGIGSLYRPVGRNKSAQFRQSELHGNREIPCRNCADLFRPT